MKRIIIVFLTLFLVVPLFSQNSEKAKEDSKQGFIPIIEIGYRIGTKAQYLWGCGIEEKSFNLWKFHITAGYKINPHLILGLGTGIHRDFPSNGSIFGYGGYIPLFADLRIFFLNNWLSPYFNAGLGYTFSTGVTDGERYFTTKGLYLNPNAGVSMKISSKFGINVGIGYELQRIPIHGTYCETFTDNSHALNLNLGLSF